MCFHVAVAAFVAVVSGGDDGRFCFDLVMVLLVVSLLLVLVLVMAMVLLSLLVMFVLVVTDVIHGVLWRWVYFCSWYCHSHVSSTFCTA